MQPLDVAATLRGKRILFVGATGFVGKVALSMFLCRYPDIGKMFVLVRPGAGSSSEDRFFTKVAASPTFDPIRERWGDGTDAFLREKCAPLAGDVARPMLNFSEADLEKIGKLDAIINCAGLVSFNPSLETALRINVLGPKHVLEVARKTGAAVVHISTCFVAGNRDGEVWEDEPLVGYFPRKDRGTGTQTDTLRDDDFSVDLEIADCQRIIDQVKSRADDRAHVSEFRDKGAARLKDEGRDADDGESAPAKSSGQMAVAAAEIADRPHARLRPDDAEQEVHDATADVAIERDAPGGFRVDRAAVGNVACRHPLLALLHRRQEFVVGLGLAHLGQQQLHRFNR